MAAAWIFRIPGLPEQYKLQDVYEELQGGSWQLWLMMDDRIYGVLLTTIIDYPLSRELTLKGIAGDRMSEWIKFISTIENYARINGCSKVVTAAARKGWSVFLPDYTSDKVVLEKKL